MADMKVVGPSGFDPRVITGLELWADFADITSLWKDTARTSAVAADTDIIKGITDKSGSGNHLSEATNGPTYKVNIQNGQSVGRFDGTNDTMKPTAALAADASWTIFMVVQKRTALPAANVSVFQLAGVNARIFGNSGVHATQWNYFSPTTATGATATSWNDVVYRVNSAASLDVYANGGTAVNLNPDDTVTSSGRDLLFANSSGAEFTDADFGEVLVYNSALTAAQLNLVGPYLAGKWGITWTTAS